MENPTPFTDEKELLLRLRERDHDAFTQLYDAFKYKLFGICTTCFGIAQRLRSSLQELF